MKFVGVFLCMCLMLSLDVWAQENIDDVREVNYYGIDFSKVKIFRAKESAEQFQTAFAAINELVIKENKKYNFGKFFKKTVDTPTSDVVDKRNHTNPPVMLPRKVSSKEIKSMQLTPAEVEEVIADYGNGDQGIGCVIIAVLLNKDAAEATYDVVFFDVKTKHVLFEKQVVGKAGGAGLRNFWANSVADALKGFKYKK